MIRSKLSAVLTITALLVAFAWMFVAPINAQTDYSVKENQVREVVRSSPDLIVDWLKTQPLAVQASAYNYLVKPPSIDEQLSKLQTIKDTLATMNDGSAWVTTALTQVNAKIDALVAERDAQ
jgi:hypothetical protein